MKGTLKLVTILLAVSLAAGCIPEKRIVWSPDGKRAAIATDNGLYFVDGDGKVLKPRLPEGPATCDWFPDSHKVAVMHVRKAKHWDDLSPLFDGEKTAQIREEAENLKKRLLAYEGNWDDFKADPEDRLASDIEMASILYVRDRMPSGLEEKLGEKWTEAQAIETDIRRVQVFEVTDDELRPGRVLLTTTRGVAGLRVSPDGRHLAFLMPSAEGRDDTPALHVLSLVDAPSMPSTSGGPSGPARMISANTAFYYDWSPDGRSLAFIRGMGPEACGDNVQLGVLSTVCVADDKGKLLEEWRDSKDHTGLLFNCFLTVEWLSDGRLFFTSAELTLPATSRDMPQRWSVFAIDPRTPAGVIRVLGRDFGGDLEPDLAYFELSPDEKRLALPCADGRVCIYEMASGKTTALVGSELPGDKTRTLPCWRNNDEVCLTAPWVEVEGEEPKVRVVLWKDGKLRSLSDTWPSEIEEGWLVDPKQ